MCSLLFGLLQATGQLRTSFRRGFALDTMSSRQVGRLEQSNTASAPVDATATGASMQRQEADAAAALLIARAAHSSRANQGRTGRASGLFSGRAMSEHRLSYLQSSSSRYPQHGAKWSKQPVVDGPRVQAAWAPRGAAGIADATGLMTPSMVPHILPQVASSAGPVWQSFGHGAAGMGVGSGGSNSVSRSVAFDGSCSSQPQSKSTRHYAGAGMSLMHHYGPVVGYHTAPDGQVFAMVPINAAAYVQRTSSSGGMSEPAAAATLSWDAPPMTGGVSWAASGASASNNAPNASSAAPPPPADRDQQDEAGAESEHSPSDDGVIWSAHAAKSEEAKHPGKRDRSTVLVNEAATAQQHQQTSDSLGSLAHKTEMTEPDETLFGSQEGAEAAPAEQLSKRVKSATSSVVAGSDVTECDQPGPPHIPAPAPIAAHSAFAARQQFGVIPHSQNGDGAGVQFLAIGAHPTAATTSASQGGAYHGVMTGASADGAPVLVPYPSYLLAPGRGNNVMPSQSDAEAMPALHLGNRTTLPTPASPRFFASQRADHLGQSTVPISGSMASHLPIVSDSLAPGMDFASPSWYSGSNRGASARLQHCYHAVGGLHHFTDARITAAAATAAAASGMPSSSSNAVTMASATLSKSSSSTAMQFKAGSRPAPARRQPVRRAAVAAAAAAAASAADTGSINGNYGGADSGATSGSAGRGTTIVDFAALEREGIDITSMAKRGRETRSAAAQIPDIALRILFAWLITNLRWPFPSKAVKDALARETGLDNTKVKYWFSNVRKRHWVRVIANGEQPRSQMDLDLVWVANRRGLPIGAGKDEFDRRFSER